MDARERCIRLSRRSGSDAMTHPVERGWRRDTATLAIDAYDEALSSTIREYVANRAPVVLSDLFSACKGAFPTLVMRHVTRLLGEMYWTHISSLASASPAPHQSRLADLQGNPV